MALSISALVLMPITAALDRVEVVRPGLGVNRVFAPPSRTLTGPKSLQTSLLPLWRVLWMRGVRRPAQTLIRRMRNRVNQSRTNDASSGAMKNDEQNIHVRSVWWQAYLSTEDFTGAGGSPGEPVVVLRTILVGRHTVQLDGLLCIAAFQTVTRSGNSRIVPLLVRLSQLYGQHCAYAESARRTYEIYLRGTDLDARRYE